MDAHADLELLCLCLKANFSMMHHILTLHAKCVLLQREVAERQTRLEEEQRSFTEALALAEKKCAEEKGRYVD